MPVLESTNRAMPRSALRHRPIADDIDRQGKRPPATTGITPIAQRASRLHPQNTEEDEEDTPGGPSTGPRSKTPRIKRTGVKRRGVLRGHPLLYLGIGMIAMLSLWTGLSLAVNWWNTTWDDIHYGRPRTFQTDAVVGHNDSSSNPSHFIALNLNGRIEVIELPGGDVSKARIYIGPQLYGTGDNLISVTLSFVDVNGNHQPDMILHFHYKGWLGFSDSEQQLVYINDQGTFRPARPDELPAVQHYLQHG